MWGEMNLCLGVDEMRLFFPVKFSLYFKFCILLFLLELYLKNSSGCKSICKDDFFFNQLHNVPLCECFTVHAVLSLAIGIMLMSFPPSMKTDVL